MITDKLVIKVKPDHRSQPPAVVALTSCPTHDVRAPNSWRLSEIRVNRNVLHVDHCVVVVVVVWFDAIAWLCFNCWFKPMLIHLNVFIIHVFKKQPMTELEIIVDAIHRK